SFLILNLFNCIFTKDLKESQNDEPLFLTPLIDTGEIIKAKELAMVKNLDSIIERESYSGFITVDEEKKSNLFFWFFPALVSFSFKKIESNLKKIIFDFWQKNPESAPIHLWLDGGPGTSVMFSLFTEHGPFLVDSEGKLGNRQYSWAN